MLKARQMDSLEKMIKETNNFLFIVEGKRDKKVLSELGVKNIISISGQTRENVVEGIENVKNIVILTDFDREGARKAEKLERLLRSSHTRIERNVRNFFNKFLKVTKIEELKEAAKLMGSVNYSKDLGRRLFSKRAKNKLSR
jgi:5S rRNA maturation endonuclease (ribonuclease M5)